jgi:Outer membrane efflux protein
MKTRVTSSPTYRTRWRFGRLVVISLLLIGSQSGCGREFYREWANQDVTEAIYEKSRDPRYRLEVFSIEPPAMARFADPYDPDRPPAPPDDFASQVTSPIPQWPDHRMILPVEGTGYLKVLEEGPRYESPKIPPPTPEEAKPDPTKPVLPPPTINRSPFQPNRVPATNPTDPLRTPRTPQDPLPTDPDESRRPPAPTAPTPGPGVSRTNSGTGKTAMSPTSLVAQASPSPAQAATAPATQPASTPPSGKDDGVRRTTMQNPSNVMLTQTIPPQQVPQLPPGRTTNPTDPLRTPRLPQDPLPTDPDESRRLPARPDLSPEQYLQSEEIQSKLASMFIPENIPFDEAVAGGLPANSRPYLLTMEKAFQLALLNSRFYQFELENVYINALPVALQRFSFSPQFIAGLSPTTAIAGAGSASGGILPTQIPANSYLNTTRGTGSQTSTLNYGTVVGVGKMFDNGAKVLASFANQLVFNFVGKNPMQPTVKSFIPVQAVVPFLRGGGRAVTLEALTQAERSLLYSIRSFALFRQQFTVATLAGGTEITFGTNVTEGGFSTGGNIDPTTGFLNVVEDVAIVENNIKNLSVFERFALVYKELIKGETSGLSQLQLDQVNQQVQSARATLISSQTTYRNDLDQFKIQLGMPPDVPIIIDRSRTRPFKEVFERIDKWSLSPRRELNQLDAIVNDLPKLEDLVLDGRSSIEAFTDRDGSSLEDLLLSAERTALENRLDLMNARGQLYDTWRQIRVTANALKGVFNVAVTNQYLTPPTTNNPFGFVNQAKQFSLVINAELPLVRVAERNNFRTALINYQRQRRTLQNTEDFLKFQLRSELRQLQQLYIQYEVTKRALILSVTVKDQSFEQIIAPPQPGVASQGPVQTNNLISAQGQVISNENNLVTFWFQYQLFRLQVYRDLGILPIDEWEAFDEIFPPDRTARSTISAAAISPDGRTAAARPGQPAENAARR